MSLSTKKTYERYKKMYDSMYTFSLCQESEINEVVRFIDSYWKKNHILVRSRNLLDWQYKNNSNNTYNFIIARSRSTEEIHAIEGFIPTTQFDPSIENAMTWGAIWKTIPELAPPGLGFVVKQFREEKYETKYNCEVGISSDARIYNTTFGNTIFELENWYIVSPYKTEFELIEATKDVNNKKKCSDDAINSILVSSTEWNERAERLSIPEYKSKLYYINRYFNHPIYEYHAIILFDNTLETQEALFYRIAEHKGNRCIFIVDYIGDGKVLANSNKILCNIIEQNNAEYILFPNFGINEKYLNKAGFKSTKQTQDIIPMYYEPFVKKNVVIACASKSDSVSWCVFKGDSDQDRPNCM